MSIVHSKRHHFELNTQSEIIKLNCLLNMYLYLSLITSNESESFLHGSLCRVMPLYLLRHKRKFPNETKALVSCLKPLSLHHSIGAFSVTFHDLGENTNITQATPPGKYLLLLRDFMNIRGRRERWKNHYWHNISPEQHSLPASLTAIACSWDGESPLFPKSFKDPAFSIHSLHSLNIINMGYFGQLNRNRGQLCVTVRTSFSFICSKIGKYILRIHHFPPHS